MSKNEVTTNDIMQFLRANMVMRSEFTVLSERVDGLEVRFSHIENKMVTKDYLDDKLAELHVRIIR